MDKAYFNIVLTLLLVSMSINIFMIPERQSCDPTVAFTNTAVDAHEDQKSPLSAEQEEYHFRELESLLAKFAGIDTSFGTHLLPLMVSVMNTHGPVFEMGSGLFSTGVLHHVTALCGHRRLLTADNSAEWLNKSLHYASERHEFIHVNYWNGREHSKFPEYSHEWDYVGSFVRWGVVLVDHDPPDRRRGHDVYRLENRTEIMLAHDANFYAYYMNFTHLPNQYCFKVPYSRVTTTIASMKVNVTQLFDGVAENVFPCLYGRMCCRIPELFELIAQYVNPDACYKSTTAMDEWWFNRCRCYSLWDENVMDSEMKPLRNVSVE